MPVSIAPCTISLVQLQPPISCSMHVLLCLCVQLALTATILLLVRYKLRGMAAVPVDGQLTWASTCYLAAVSDWPEACTYGKWLQDGLCIASEPHPLTTCSTDTVRTSLWTSPAVALHIIAAAAERCLGRSAVDCELKNMLLP